MAVRHERSEQGSGAGSTLGSAWEDSLCGPIARRVPPAGRCSLLAARAGENSDQKADAEAQTRFGAGGGREGGGTTRSRQQFTAQAAEVDAESSGVGQGGTWAGGQAAGEAVSQVFPVRSGQVRPGQVRPGCGGVAAMSWCSEMATIRNAACAGGGALSAAARLTDSVSLDKPGWWATRWVLSCCASHPVALAGRPLPHW